MKVLLFFCLVLAPPLLAEKLQYLYTAFTPGTNVTVVGLLDGRLLFNYDGKMKTLIHKLECLNRSNEDVWKLQKDWIWGIEQDLTPFLSGVMKDFNHSEGLHTWQWMFGCELYNNTTTVNDQCCYDGEHAITLDPQNLTWTTSSDEARAIKKRWEATGHHAKDHKRDLETKCIDLLKHFMSGCKKTLAMKVPPEVSVFHNHSPSPEVGTLPNHDGSFQKRIIPKVPAEELQKHNYTCMEKEIGKEVPKGEGLDGRTISIIIAVPGALVAFVAGIVSCKKKKKKKISDERSEERNISYTRAKSGSGEDSISFMGNEGNSALNMRV